MTNPCDYFNDLEKKAKLFGYFDWREFLKDYYVMGCSTTRIAQMIGRSPTWVRSTLIDLGVKLRSRGGPNNRKKG